MKSKKRFAIPVFLITFLAAAVQAQEARKLRAGYASLSGNMAPYWVAKEGGYFKKHGLDIDMVAFFSERQ
jgi:ABC-type nitrate/sulfonate/bicarbonate transport system substrate-binding protein